MIESIRNLYELGLLLDKRAKTDKNKLPLNSNKKMLILHSVYQVTYIGILRYGNFKKSDYNLIIQELTLKSIEN